jgi:hypothetical protein
MQELGLKLMGNFVKKNGEKRHNECESVLSYGAAFNKLRVLISVSIKIYINSHRVKDVSKQ